MSEIPEIDPDEFRWLNSLAVAAAMRVLSGSARSNLTDDVAAQAVTEYWQYVQKGNAVENPAGLVVTIAKRRALNAQRNWGRRRDLRLGAADDDNEMIVSEGELPSGDQIKSGLDDVTWFLELSAGEAGGARDVEIARKVWIEGFGVEQVGSDLGIAPSTVRNRMTAIKAAARDRVEAFPRSDH